MKYISTRDSSCVATSAKAILTGLSPDGGLFVPEKITAINLEVLLGKSYTEIAKAVLENLLPDYDPAFLQTAINESYGENFGGKAGKLVKLEDGLFALELWHGPTAAFKDYALQLMPHLLVQAKKMLDDNGKTLILVATSGDTGKAALDGYKNRDNIGIAVFYPDAGTSEIQRLQMATQEGGNLEVFAVTGNFDDTQRGVKLAFSDKDLAKQLSEKNISLSSANSINWGRLVPQIVYYVTSYLSLCSDGDVKMGAAVDFCVPTGNFGDILAGYYAKMLGVPIGKLICAANQNNVLADFMQTGTYNARREFHKTSSPSMDILVSSNFERLLYHACGSSFTVRGWMEELNTKGEYTVDDTTMSIIRKDFAAGWADEQAVSAEISRLYKEYNYLCDPHTAVAFDVWKKQADVEKRPTVIISTASPFKFCGKVLEALGESVPANEFEALQKLEIVSGQKAPKSLSSLQGKEVLFTKVICIDEIQHLALKLDLF